MIVPQRALLCLLAAVVAGCSSPLREPGDLDIRVPESRSLIIDDAADDRQSVIPIELRSTFATPLTLSLNSKSCTCIDVRLPTEAIPGGAARKVDVSAAAGPGKHRVGFIIAGKTAAGTVVEKSAELKFSVFPRQEAAPKSLIRALAVGDAEPIVLTLRVHTSDSDPKPRDHKISVFKVPDFLTAEPAKSLGVLRVAADVVAMEWEIKLRRREETRIGPKTSRHGQIEIACDSLSPCVIPYHFTCLDELTVSPEVIYFDPTAVGQHADRYAIVQIGAKDAVSIPAVKSSQPDFLTEPLESLPSAAPDGTRLFRIKVRFAPRKKGASRSEITVSLNVPQRREARIVAMGTGI